MDTTEAHSRAELATADLEIGNAAIARSLEELEGLSDPTGDELAALRARAGALRTLAGMLESELDRLAASRRDAQHARDQATIGRGLDRAREELGQVG